MDLNHRPLGYEPNELPDCSTPRTMKLYYILSLHVCEMISQIFPSGLAKAFHDQLLKLV